MARKIMLVDDLDGSEAAETVHFALDGVSYTIDLSSKNAAALRKVLEPYTSKGLQKGQSNGELDTKVVRVWAAENGLACPAKGRLPAELVDKYKAAHPAGKKLAVVPK